MMDDNAWFSQLAKAADARERAALDLARQDPSKEPFDLDRLEALLDTTSSLGTLPPREAREHTWAVRYYVRHPDVRTLAEFAALMAWVTE